MYLDEDRRASANELHCRSRPIAETRATPTSRSRSCKRRLLRRRSRRRSEVVPYLAAEELDARLLKAATRAILWD